MNKDRKYKISFKRNLLGIILITPNIQNTSQWAATIIPMNKQGSWTEDDVTITLNRHTTVMYDIDIDFSHICNDLLVKIEIDPEDITLVEYV